MVRASGGKTFGRWGTALLAVAGMAACGGGGGPAGPGAGGAAFTADIDGQSWVAGLGASATAGAGGITLVGVSGTGAAVSIALFHVAAPGTFPLGVGPSVPGGIATVSLAPNAWSTPLSGAAGSVTITSVSATRIAGTFSYVAEPVLGGQPRTVTNGRFDLPVTANAPIAVAPNAGSTFGGSMDGAPWNAASIAMVSGPVSGTLAVGISNIHHHISLIISGWTGPGNYVLGTGAARYLSVNSAQGNMTWGNSGRANGTFVVTNETAARITGTYDVTLQPGSVNPGPAPLRLVGTFSFGIP